MKSELISVSILETTSAAGAIVSFIEQVEPILRFVAAAIAIVSGLISIVLTIAVKTKKAAEDGEITADEVKEIVEEVKPEADRLKKALEQTQKDWAERKE